MLTNIHEFELTDRWALIKLMIGRRTRDDLCVFATLHYLADFRNLSSSYNPSPLPYNTRGLLSPSLSNDSPYI